MSPEGEQGRFWAEDFPRRRRWGPVIISDSLDYPVASFLEKIVISRKITLKKLRHLLDINPENRRGLGLDSLSILLERAPETLELSDEETEELVESVSREIETRLASGQQFGMRPVGRRLTETQKRLPCRTYNGEQAAQVLGVGKTRVSQIRAKLGLSMLLTDEDLDLIRRSVQRTPWTKIAPLSIDTSG